MKSGYNTSFPQPSRPPSRTRDGSRLGLKTNRHRPRGLDPSCSWRRLQWNKQTNNWLSYLQIKKGSKQSTYEWAPDPLFPSQ
jgi:hypothetical protein